MSLGQRQVGSGGSSGAPLSFSISTQVPHTTTTISTVEVISTIAVFTNTSMSATQVLSTDPATVTTSETITAAPSSLPDPPPSPFSKNDTPLLHDSIIIASVLGGFTILLIAALAVTYCLYKHRRRQRELDYSPPFTSLAPQPRSALSPLTIGSFPIPPEELYETSLSMGPGIRTGTADSHPQRHPQGTAPQQSKPDPQSQSVPAITLQPSPMAQIDKEGGEAQSERYHDLLREETENNAARRNGRLDAPELNALRPISALSGLSNIETGQLRASNENERERVFPSTRASSGVFPDY